MLQEIYNEEVGEYSFNKFKGFDLLLHAPFTTTQHLKVNQIK